VKFTASVDSKWNLALLEFRAERGDAVGDLGGVEGEARIADVGGCDQLANALVNEPARVLDALFKVARAIIDGGQNVAMDIYV
jgi:hypothetical protein